MKNPVKKFILFHEVKHDGEPFRYKLDEGDEETLKDLALVVAKKSLYKEKTGVLWFNDARYYNVGVIVKGSTTIDTNARFILIENKTDNTLDK